MNKTKLQLQKSGIHNLASEMALREKLEHIALRWSAQGLGLEGYKHRAPLEHFAVRAHAKPPFVQKPNENLFCYGDGSGDELDESGRLKIRHHKHYFNPAGEKLR